MISKPLVSMSSHHVVCILIALNPVRLLSRYEWCFSRQHCVVFLSSDSPLGFECKFVRKSRSLIVLIQHAENELLRSSCELSESFRLRLGGLRGLAQV
ncbi:hypothetical protein AHF37_01264 [Paragonimus kellicotti]|nr:hypothetical protein AHF37_01264 [Paragonimus kellicotti]